MVDLWSRECVGRALSYPGFGIPVPYCCSLWKVRGQSLGEGEAVPASWLRHAGMFRCEMLLYILLHCVSFLVPVVLGALAG